MFLIKHMHSYLNVLFWRQALKKNMEHTKGDIHNYQ